MTASYDITITDADGSNPLRVRVAPTGVPGLVIHPSPRAEGWVITHVPTGRMAAWWPGGNPEQLLACARKLGTLGDWDVADLALLPLPEAMWVVLDYGGSVRARNFGPSAWRSFEDGEVVVTHYVGTDAA